MNLFMKAPISDLDQKYTPLNTIINPTAIRLSFLPGSDAFLEEKIDMLTEFQAILKNLFYELVNTRCFT